MRTYGIVPAVFIAFIAILFSLPTAAEESFSPYCTTHPNDGSGLPECFTPTDNECYAGGVLDGKCVDQWTWDAGWYLGRLNRGFISREDFPQQYISVLPPLDESPGIIEVCKVAFGNRYCISSDKTGTRDAGNDGSVEEVERFLPPGSSVCPNNYIGPYPITVGYGGLFSNADLAPLGMDTTWMYCYKSLL